LRRALLLAERSASASHSNGIVNRFPAPPALAFTPEPALRLEDGRDLLTAVFGAGIGIGGTPECQQPGEQK
jgi:hypothetical protein